ncbi:hypothetical protein LV89_02885 [Arcicella aurantiaca]|uniref:LPP20 lipoprotein n=1 Tax=Arcicella aurantiaca TaxID=591202 RepID=A0A316E498_9BACT|nr:hypothetical protein [Arcicella aurantiaca]PWK24372.1 hypothetical protein LV89_02885 [Arcicella aurantiaca]
MKKTYIISSLVLLLNLSISEQTLAQGFFQKLKEKAEAATSGIGGEGSAPRASKALYEKQQTDAAKNVLENKGVTKDKYGLGGIYYTRELFVCGSQEGKPDKAIGKFLVSFEKEQNAVKVKLTPSYSIEENIPTLVLGRNDYPADLVLKISSAINQPRFDATLSNGAFYGFYAKQRVVKDGSYVKESKETLANCSGLHCVLIEPGLILVTQGSGLYYIPKNGRDADDVTKEKMEPVMVLYAKDKEAKAKSLTDEQLYEMLITHQKAFQKRDDLKIDGQKEAEKEINAANAHLFNGGGSSSSKSSSSKESSSEKTFRIELQNLTGDDVYYTVKGMSNTLKRIGSKMIQSEAVKAGVTIVTKSGNTIAAITESTKPSTRFKIQ